MRLSPPADLEELTALLDAAERARASEIHFERDRRHYVAARGLLRRLLGAALDRPASALPFQYGAHGKPALASAFMRDRTLSFNLSHSAGWAMFALAWDRDVGIDLESLPRLKRDGDGLAGLAARVLSARELPIWQALPKVAREPAFLRAWTRKEAYAKATCQGLLDELILTDVALDAAAPKSSLTLRSQQKGRNRPGLVPPRFNGPGWVRRCDRRREETAGSRVTSSKNSLRASYPRRASACERRRFLS